MLLLLGCAPSMQHIWCSCQASFEDLLLLLMSLSTAILLVHTDYALETYSACGLLGRVSQS